MSNDARMGTLIKMIETLTYNAPKASTKYRSIKKIATHRPHYINFTHFQLTTGLEHLT